MNIVEDIDVARATIQSIAQTSLSQAIESRGSAVLALSGGSTPKLYLPSVFALDLPWDKVTLTLADERWVPPTDPDSNEKLIEDLRRDTPAQVASLLSLWSCGSSPEEAATKSRELAHAQQMVIDLLLLGMGDDGHIASLFPGDNRLHDSSAFWIPVEAPTPPNVPLARLSLSATTLLKSKYVTLVFSGQEKYDIWNRAWAPDETPIRFPVSLLKSHPALETICIMDTH